MTGQDRTGQKDGTAYEQTDVNAEIIVYVDVPTRCVLAKKRLEKYYPRLFCMNHSFIEKKVQIRKNKSHAQILRKITFWQSV